MGKNAFMITVPGVVAAMLLIALPASSEAQTGSSCSCDDVRSIRARLCASRAALKEWDRLIGLIQQREEQSGQVEQFSRSGKVDVAHCVDEIIDIDYQEWTVENPLKPGEFLDVDRVGGETNPLTFSCAPKVEKTASARSEPSACLKENLMAHESVHVKRCEAQKSEWGLVQSLWGWRDYRAERSLVDYMREEMSGYAVEVNFLATRLMELSEKCPRAMFLKETPKGMIFSIEGCRKPDMTRVTGRTCKFP
jgi:hypothetical protein